MSESDNACSAIFSGIITRQDVKNIKKILGKWIVFEEEVDLSVEEKKPCEIDIEANSFQTLKKYCLEHHIAIRLFEYEGTCATCFNFDGKNRELYGHFSNKVPSIAMTEIAEAYANKEIEALIKKSHPFLNDIPPLIVCYSEREHLQAIKYLKEWASKQEYPESALNYIYQK